MAEDKRATARAHNVVMEGRKSLSMSGVTDVDSFDEQTVVVYTDLGELTVKGSGLHIEKMDIELGEIALTGNIFGLMYTDEREKGGLFSRIFR